MSYSGSSEPRLYSVPNHRQSVAVILTFVRVNLPSFWYVAVFEAIFSAILTKHSPKNHQSINTMFKFYLISALLALIPSVYSESCVKPEVTSTSFTTQDARIVTNIAYISDFTLKCGSGQASALYAEVNGNVAPVSIVGTNQYQVSWTEDIKTARSGDKIVRIFDEDGYTVLKKALRAGESLSSVASLVDVTVYHPGAYNGPWLQSELFATLVSLVVAYFAITFKLKVAV